MENLKKNYKSLKTLSICKKGLRNQILTNADDSVINNICECVLNTLNGNVKLPPQKLSNLKKYKKTLKKLVLTKNVK